MLRFAFPILYSLLTVLAIAGATSCAQIIPPGGGPRDTLPPVLVAALPKDSALRVNTNKIQLTFDEYVQLDNPVENVVVSPYPKNTPNIDGRLRNVTIKLRDSLEPNTTYSIQFGKSVKDVNEGNIDKDFTYVFSTGNYIDSNEITGNVRLAETGKVDSTLIVILHRNLSDTAVVKLPPRYYARLDGKGNFRFRFLPPGRFNVFVLAPSYSKKYDDSTTMFAFLDSSVAAAPVTSPVSMYAYQEAKEKPKVSRSTAKERGPVRLRYQVNIAGGIQGLLDDIQLTFSRPLRSVDSQRIVITDTNYHALTGVHYSLDTGNTILGIRYPWPEETHLRLILPKDAVTDTSGNNLLKSDTLKFTTKKLSEYASLKLHFVNLDSSVHPVLQLYQNDKLFESIPVKSPEFYRPVFQPGEYEMRILYDLNANGVWDPGYYHSGRKRQPERVILIPRKLAVRANFDNEHDVPLK